MQPLISVIIPAYNIENYIERCLKSVCEQTYENMEIIVIDDGSIDQTGKIIDRLADGDPRIIPIHKKNAGVSAARNSGLDRATGDYIGFVDGDDIIEKDMYEILVNNAVKYDADISHCGYRMVYPDGHTDLYYGTEKIVKQNNYEGIRDLLSGEYIEPGLWNKLYRKLLFHAIDKSPLWNSEIRINEDLLMNYILFKKADCSIYQDIPLYQYILRVGSAATSKKDLYKITDPLKVINIIKEDVKQDSELYSIVYTRFLRVLINNAVQTNWPYEAKFAQDKLKKEINADQIKNCESKKVKLMALGAVYMLPIYKMIRRIYDAVTGVSKKYDLTS